MGIKSLIKKKLINDSHPFLMSLWLSWYEHRVLAKQEAHSRMSYAAIESAISRKYERVFGRRLEEFMTLSTRQTLAHCLTSS